VAKYMGDGVLIYFGYHEAHEHDAERAVRAGLEMVAAITALKSSVSLQTRVGIATGVVVGDLIGSGEAQEQSIAEPAACLCRGLSLLALAAFVLWSNSATANPYDKCMLDHAATIKDSSSEGIDAIAEACIKSTEEPLDPEEAPKVKFNYLYGEMVRGLGELGLIVQVYNGSSYDISSLTLSLADKRTKTQQQFRHELWYPYNRGPGIVTSYGPRYRNRFILSLTSGEYMFPIGAINVPQADFFKRYDVEPVSARGVRH